METKLNKSFNHKERLLYDQKSEEKFYLAYLVTPNILLNVLDMNLYKRCL